MIQKVISFPFVESIKNKEGVFHFNLCYPDLLAYDFLCNEWVQSSNPINELTITGYDGNTLTILEFSAGTLEQNYQG